MIARTVADFYFGAAAIARFCIGQVADDHTSERIGNIAKSFEILTVKVQRASSVVIFIFWLDAVIRTLQIAMHGFVFELNSRIVIFDPLTARLVVYINSLTRFVTARSSATFGILVLRDRDPPAVSGIVAIIDVVRNRIGLSGGGDSIRIAVCAASGLKTCNALVNLDFVRSSIFLVRCRNVGKVSTEVVTRFAGFHGSIRHIAIVESVERIVVIPELVALVFPAQGIDLFAVGRLILSLYIPIEDIRSRAGAVFGILEAIQKGCLCKNTVVNLSRHANIVTKRGGHHIARRAAQLAKETCGSMLVFADLLIGGINN